MYHDEFKREEYSSTDQLFLDYKTLFHSFSTATCFSALKCLDSNGESYFQSVKGIWLAIFQARYSVYLIYPNCL